MAPSSNTAQKGQDYSYVGTYSECLCAGHCFRSTSRQARNRLGLDSFQHSRVHITLLLLCEEQKRQNAARVKRYWEIIADNLSKAGWSWGCVSAIDSDGQTIWIVDAHRDDGKRFVARVMPVLLFS